MKTLFLIGGTMGVGKTAACQKLKERLPACVFLDGDWCWDMHPFQVTPETKALVMDNIRHLLNSFLRCAAFENVVFCWVMHEQGIINDILSRLDLADARVISVSLTCSEAELRRRLQEDVNAGARQADVIGRSVPRLPLYDRLNTLKLDTTFLSPEQTAEKLANL